MSDQDSQDVQHLARDLLGRPLDQDLARAMLKNLPGEKLHAFISFVIDSLLPRDHSGVFWGDRMMTIDKSSGFLDDPLFAEALDDIRQSHTYDGYRSPHGIAWRIHTLCWAGQQALSLPHGDFVECGVFKGDMAWCIAKVCNIAASGRQFYLYDSFSGFDPRLNEETEIPDFPGYFAFANSCYKQDGLYEHVANRFKDAPHMHVRRGVLPEALDSAPLPDAIAFLHIDLNSPTAEKACLERLFDRVLPCGVIVLDDYGWKVFHKQKKVADTFFETRNLRVMELPTGQGIVIKL